VTEGDGPPTNEVRRPVPRQGPSGRPVRRLPRRRYDPPPRTIGEALQRLWVVGLLAVLLVDVLVLVTGPGDISILRRFFIWFSTFFFSAWLLREHRRRLRSQQRQGIFLICSASLILLFLILVISDF